MVQIKWLKSAKNDLKSIYDFISLDSQKYAQLQIYRLIDGVNIIKTTPFIGKKVIEINDNNIREIVVGNYRIIYKVLSKQLIHILMVHHGARSLKKRLK